MTSIDVRSGLNGAPTSVSDRDTGAVDPGGSTPGDDRWPEDTPRAGLRRLGYQPALDGLRGLALVAIVVYHAELPGAPGAFLSVSTFFTLSGFLITALAMTEFASTGALSLRQFWARRTRRLLPAALCSIAVILAASVVLADATQLARLPGDGLASLLYVANWRFIFTGESYGAMFQSPSPFTHFWTLSIEEQFYLFFPVVVAGTLVISRGNRRALAFVFGALVAASTIWGAVLLAGGATIDRIYYGTDTRLAELVAGSLLALWWTRARNPGARRHTRRFAVIGAGALVLMIVLWATMYQDQRIFYTGGLTLYACVTLAVILGALQPAGLVHNLLGMRPLVWVGKVSYGAYLLHWPILMWLDHRAGLAPAARFAVGLPLTLLLAGLFTRLVEKPIRLNRLLPGRHGLVALPVAITVVLALVVTTTKVDRPDNTTVNFEAVADRLNASSRATPDIAPLMPGQPAAPAAHDADATRLAASTAPRVGFFGDSTALMTGFGFGDWAYATNLEQLTPQVGSAQLGCGLLTGVTRIARNQPGGTLRECDHYLDDWRKTTTEYHSDIAVVQLGPWDVLDTKIPPSDKTLVIGRDPDLDALLEARLRDAVKVLLEHVRTVVLVASPDIVAGMVDSRPPTVAYRESDPARMARFRELVRSVAATTPHVKVADLAGWFSSRPDQWQLRPDGIHSTEKTSRTVGEWLGPEILRLYREDQN